MNKKQFFAALAVTCVFSFLGGIVGGAITGGSRLLARDGAASTGQMEVVTDHIKTKKLTIINDQGEVNGVFGHDGAGRTYLETSNIKLINNSGKLMGHLGVDMDEDPLIKFYTNNKPGGFSPEKRTFETPVLHFGIDNGDPFIILYDKESDERISFGINRSDPFLNISYQTQTRIRLGTNYIGDTATGKQQRIKGSLCFFDHLGNLMRQLP